MTPEAIKLLAIVLARDGGFFDIKANVAARTELGARVTCASNLTASSAV